MNNETIMSAEEFFGELENDKTPARTGKARGKRSADDLFDKVKVRMVMRIYGVSRARARAIIAGRADEKLELERAKEPPPARSRRRSPMMSAADFFAED